MLLGVLAVLCVAALVATGRGDGLAEAPRDRSPFGELPDDELSPEHLKDLKFSLAFRGYRMDEVDAVIERLSAELAARDARIAELDKTQFDETQLDKTQSEPS